MEGRATSREKDSRDEESLNPEAEATLIPKYINPKETFVVQMPRDQVYRVPPPEHAKMVENYKNAPKEKKCVNVSWCCWLLIALSILGIGIAIFLIVARSLFRPKSPIFHVTSIHANNLANNKTRLPPSFDVGMEVSNPNSGVRASYKNGGNSSLIFKNVSIGGGELQQLSQDENISTNVNLKLDGKKDGSSKNINTALNNIYPKFMILKIDVTIKMMNWIKSKSKDMKVTCNFNVKSIGKDKAEILTEDCQTDF